jgi:ABC-type transport system involved in multi-copper enzyme maturation permease subunit
MLATVIKKEWIHQVTSSRFVTVTAILLLLSLLAAVAGTGDYSRRQRNHETHQEQSEKELAELHLYSFLQPAVVAAPEPLSVLARGFEGWLGEPVRVRPFAVPMAATGGHPGNDFMAGAPDLDLTMIVQLVLGLLALLLTFDAVVGEKEAGTLRLVLANDVSRWSVVAGKFLGACLALLIPLLSGAALTVAVLYFRGGVALDLPRWQRLAGLLAVYVAYLSVMALVGLWISCRSRSTSSALVLALLAWLAIVFLIPQTAATLAGELAETDSIRRAMDDELGGLEAERSDELRDLRKEYPLLESGTVHLSPVFFRDNGRELRRYGTRELYDEAAAYHREATRISLEYADRGLEACERYEERLHRSERRAKVLFWLSPASLMERVAESLAGTSSADSDDHLAAVRAYREELIRYLRERDAFTSWRWFTDDVEPYPWPRFLGLQPEDVDETNFGRLFKEYAGNEIQARVAARDELYDEDPARRLDLRDLLVFEPRRAGMSRAVRRVLPEWSALTLFNLAAAAAALGGIGRERPPRPRVRPEGVQPRDQPSRQGAPRREDGAAGREAPGQ